MVLVLINAIEQFNNAVVNTSGHCIARSDILEKNK